MINGSSTKKNIIRTVTRFTSMKEKTVTTMAANSTLLPPVKVDQETIANKMSPMLHNSAIV